MKKNLKIALKVFGVCFLIAIGLGYSDYEIVSFFDLLDWQNLLAILLYALVMTLTIMMLYGFVKLIISLIRNLRKQRER